MTEIIMKAKKVIPKHKIRWIPPMQLYNSSRHLAYPVLKLCVWTLLQRAQQEGKVCAKFQIQYIRFHSKSYTIWWRSKCMQMWKSSKFVLNFNKFIDFFLDGDFVTTVDIQICRYAQDICIYKRWRVTLSWRWCRGAMVKQ